MSAALAVGAVSMASGLLPGEGYKIGGGNDSAGQVQAGGPPDSGLGPQGSESVSPTGGASAPASPGDDRTGAPGSTPSTTPPKAPSKPSGTPSTDPTNPPASSGPSGPGKPAGGGGSDDGGRGGGGGGGGSSDAKDPTPPEASKPAPPAGGDRPAEPGGREPAAEKQVLKRVNKERAKAGCGPVTADPKLDQLAQDFSDDMALRGFFDHINPDGESPWDRAARAGIVDLGGENIARGQSTADEVVDTWMDSSSHRANILNCSYKTMGVGAHFGGDGPWWTQNFGF